MNVFQFAETVEQDAWEDEQQKQGLQVRTTRLPLEHRPETLSLLFAVSYK